MEEVSHQKEEGSYLPVWELHVHHTTYEHGWLPLPEDEGVLKVLCEQCHDAAGGFDWTWANIQKKIKELGP